MVILPGLIVLIFLFAFSAFWSGSETALTSLSKYRIKKMIALNKPLSSTLAQWLKAPYYLLTMILVANTVTDLLLSYIATVLALQIFAPYLPREVIEVVNWLIVTFLLLLFAEVAPKIYSRRNPEQVTLKVLPTLSHFMKLTNVVVAPVSSFFRRFFPRLNLVPVGRLAFVSLEEIKGLIIEANSSGVLGKETSIMLEGALRIGSLEVRNIMTPVGDIDAVNLYQDEEKFLDRVVETGRSRVPVYNTTLNKIAGFIHTKDLLWCWKKNKGSFSRETIRPPYFVYGDKKVSELLKEFQTGQTHMAFVIDAMGNIAGLVTLEDVLECIVGEILDEYDLKKDEQP